MTAISPQLQQDLVREAARAPSAHNTQPARWRFDGDRVTLLRAADRILPVGDPSGHDLGASLGAAWEGMAIALSTRGLVLGQPGEARGAAPSGCAAVAAAATTMSDGEPDPLAPFVELRRSYRGKFAKVSPRELSALNGVKAPDVIIAFGTEHLTEIALLHDAATWAYESTPAYHEELWNWLRLDRGDPRYSLDGLNGDCLALSGAEQWAARRLLAPRTFDRLKSIGIARHLVSEAAQVKSASAAILFAPKADMPAFDVGRRMYRLWLEITAAGFFLAPMSASADHDETREQLARRFSVPADRRIANVFRVGCKELSAVALSPRLAVADLLV